VREDLVFIANVLVALVFLSFNYVFLLLETINSFNFREKISIP